MWQIIWLYASLHAEKIVRILFLDLDTLRPDHLGCYGYHRNTSPNIDHIAEQGIRFTNYYCSDAPCLPSRAALFTGRFGIHTGIVNHGMTNADMRIEGPSRDFQTRLNRESLPGALRQLGMRTVSISPFAERHSAWWFYAGFNEMHNTGHIGMESAEEITPTVLKWIEQNAKEDNWFLHVNYWDPHTPYRAPPEFGNPFEKEPVPDWITPEVFKKHRRHPGPHGANDMGMYSDQIDPGYPRHPGEVKDMQDLRRVFDGYDCGIRYLDTHIGRLLEALDKQGVKDDLAIIISGDHAENIGELGIYSEHATADYNTCRIPMIIRWPGARSGHVDDGFHYNLDLPPTLIDLMGGQKAPSWDGRSYSATVTDGKDCGRENIVISQCAHVCQRGVRFGPWMFIRTYHDGFHLFPDEMLYNIESDPHEQDDLADSNPEVCREAVHILNQWHEEMMRTMLDGYDTDPLWTVMKEGGPHHARGHLREYCKRLEKTGRGYAIEELKRRHPREFL